MSLAETHSAVDEKRVPALAGLLCDGERGRVGKLVAVADDKSIKCIVSVEFYPGNGTGSGSGALGIILSGNYTHVAHPAGDV